MGQEACHNFRVSLGCLCKTSKTWNIKKWGGDGEMSTMHTVLAESMRVEFGAQNLYKKSTVVVRFVIPTIQELETGAPLGL